MSNKNDFMEAGTEAQEMQSMLLREQPTQMSLNEIRAAYTELRHDLALLATWETEISSSIGIVSTMDSLASSMCLKLPTLERICAVLELWFP